MKNLDIVKLDSWPDEQNIEVVERKGYGHPDTLADSLANKISNEYSKYCLSKFGVVPHHNFDKLYIGGGHFLSGFNINKRIKPFIIRTNGRVSDSFCGDKIPYKEIQQSAIQNHLSQIFPNIKKDDYIIKFTSTQHTKINNWFSPLELKDIPDFYQPRANDTSLCVASYPMTMTEKITLEIENFFWTRDDNKITPKYQEIGRDIKVLSIRNYNKLEVTVALPLLSDFVKSQVDYDIKIKFYEDKLKNHIEKTLANYDDFEIELKVNPYSKNYILSLGSCIECGEEGLVGRGNNYFGIISSNRPYTLESWAGKNPIYHTGRVYGYISARLSKLVSQNFDCNCNLKILTRNGDNLFPPFKMIIESNKTLNKSEVSAFIEKLKLSSEYVNLILNDKKI